MDSPYAIVVGGGLSGLSAAHTLVEKGANVLVLDKNPFFGGNSTKATSGINGAGTRAQAALGINDTVKAFFDDTKKSARDLAREDLIEVLTGRSGDAVNWLQDKFGLDLSKVSRLGGHSYQRTHRGGAQFPGMTITYAQMEALEDLATDSPDRVKILKKAAVTSLIKEGDKVVGVNYTYQDGQHKAYGPVILATGGYGSDFSKDGLLAKYRPDLMHLPTTNGDHCTGDGAKMVLDIGGKAIDMDKVQVHPTGLVDPNEPDAKVKFLAAEALRGVGGLILDNEANRLADELGHRDYVTGEMWKNGKFPIRLVLNGEATKEIEWHCKHYVGRGLMKKFDTAEELAKEMNLPESKIKQTFDDYMKVCKDPKTDPFGKKFFQNTNWDMGAGPFHVASITPVVHFSMGGIRINARSEVLDLDEKVVPGLFASGEVAGGVHGANRLGGSALLGCVVYGRVAGDTAASYLLKSLSSGQVANGRLQQVGGQLGMATTVRIDPQSKKVHLEFSWDEQTKSASASSAEVHSAGPKTDTVTNTPATEVGEAAKKTEKKEFTMDEVAKHNQKDDCWVVIGGQVLDATKFLADHPGGAKAILLYAGKEATEEFEMVHAANTISKYAQHIIIGDIKEA